MRLCDLGLTLEGTALQVRVDQLHEDLAEAGLRFRPYVWLSYDWFCPDGITGFAIPFYLAHPRLVRLEHREMFEVEGATRDLCLRILRHETAHAIDNAYRLRRRKRWRETFGRVSEPYLATYRPRPNSRRYVQNLDFWYAQSHPLEDWAETFAVWLRPGNRWRQRYDRWPALRKLEYVDELMDEVATLKPPIRTRERPDSLPRLRMTLREHYRRKKASWSEDFGSEFDWYLRRLFTSGPGTGRYPGAAGFLRRHRARLRRVVADAAGQHRYVVDQAIKELEARCRTLELRQVRADPDMMLELVSLLTVVTTRFSRRAYMEFRR